MYRSFSKKHQQNILCRFIMNTEKKCVNYFYQNIPANERIREITEKSSSPIPLQMSKGKNKDHKKVKKTSHWSPHLNKMFSSFSAPLSQDSNLFYTILNKWNTFKIISSTLHCQLQRNVGFLFTSFFPDPKTSCPLLPVLTKFSSLSTLLCCTEKGKF